MKSKSVDVYLSRETAHVQLDNGTDIAILLLTQPVIYHLSLRVGMFER
jgi:hypothetical protein